MINKIKHFLNNRKAHKNENKLFTYEEEKNDGLTIIENNKKLNIYEGSSEKIFGTGSISNNIEVLYCSNLEYEVCKLTCMKYYNSSNADIYSFENKLEFIKKHIKNKSISGLDSTTIIIKIKVLNLGNNLFDFLNAFKGKIVYNVINNIIHIGLAFSIEDFRNTILSMKNLRNPIYISFMDKIKEFIPEEFFIDFIELGYMDNYNCIDYTEIENNYRSSIINTLNNNLLFYDPMDINFDIFTVEDFDDALKCTFIYEEHSDSRDIRSYSLKDTLNTDDNIIRDNIINTLLGEINDINYLSNIKYPRFIIEENRTYDNIDEIID